MKTIIEFLNNTIAQANRNCEFFSIPCLMIEKRVARAIKNNDRNELLCILNNFASQHSSTLYIFGREEQMNTQANEEYNKRVEELSSLQAEVAEFVESEGFNN